MSSNPVRSEPATARALEDLTRCDECERLFAFAYELRCPACDQALCPLCATPSSARPRYERVELWRCRGCVDEEGASA